MTAVDTDAARVLRAAQFVARRWARSVGLDAASAEDVAQEIALRVILAHRRGYRCGRRAYAMMLRDARRALYGDERDGRETVWRHVASGVFSRLGTKIVYRYALCCCARHPGYVYLFSRRDDAPRRRVSSEERHMATKTTKPKTTTDTDLMIHARHQVEVAR